METPLAYPPHLEPLHPEPVTPNPTTTHRKLKELFTQKWLLLIFGLMVVIGFLYLAYLFTNLSSNSKPLNSVISQPTQSTTQPSCQYITPSGELSFLQNYCTGYYCTEFSTQTECESIDVVSVENNTLSESSVADGLPDCLWNDTATPGYQCQIAYP